MKRFIAITTVLAGLILGASLILISPTEQSTVYEQTIEARLSRHTDGALELAVVVVTREGLDLQVQNKLKEHYAKTGIALIFVNNFNASEIDGIVRRSSQPTHIFDFSKEHHRNGWAGVDVLYNGPSGKKEAFTIQVSK